ncbi:VOC family protein [Nocardioides sp. LMS-CY]|uniref:VOC family protein n=1 Tax=Nocardioides sp. (strain LMS-CY) TaxID=2840457 RepID=UPI001C0076C0|nr:VOC family protein [Nocardioides sp. LMS-CY]QWF21128.1 VOC family protein [Nocardioides sp. LMS-CY]
MVTWQLTIDANDPDRLARFWAPLLGYEPQPPPPGHASWVDWYRSVGVPEEELTDIGPDYCDRLHDPSGEGPTIWFQIVPEGKTVTKNRLHLDVYPGGRDKTRPMEQRRREVQETVDRVVAQGATVVRSVLDEHSCFAVMQDPEGNEFCVS